MVHCEVVNATRTIYPMVTLTKKRLSFQHVNPLQCHYSSVGQPTKESAMQEHVEVFGFSEQS